VHFNEFWIAISHIWTYLIWELRFYVTEMRKNKSKVCFVESSFDPLLSILKVIFLESNPLRFIETLISFIRGFVYCLYMPGLKLYEHIWYENYDFMSQKWEKINQKFVLLKVASDKEFGQHFP
jgi:hypothetical protein